MKIYDNQVERICKDYVKIAKSFIENEIEERYDMESEIISSIKDLSSRGISTIKLSHRLETIQAMKSGNFSFDYNGQTYYDFMYFLTQNTGYYPSQIKSVCVL
jgi:hypothetical protein